VAAQTGDTTIHACVQDSTGAITILADPSGYTNPLGTHCQGTLGSPLHALDFSQQGPQGAVGPAGATGPAGANASLLFAHVSAGGKVQSASPGISSSLTPSGVYRLSFPGNDTDCAPIAVPSGGSKAHTATKPANLQYVVPSSMLYSGTITQIQFPEVDAGGKDAGAIMPKDPFNVYLLCPPA
jgi:hypothetical protein